MWISAFICTGKSRNSSEKSKLSVSSTVGVKYESNYDGDRYFVRLFCPHLAEMEAK